MPRRQKHSLLERLEKRSITEAATGCRLWLKPDRHGYGALTYEGRSGQAHRFSWIAHRGPIPAGLCVLHRCDVRACINPDHLFLGTKGDNNRDRHAKGRNNSHKRRGEANGWAKLTADKVRAILVDPRSRQAIADEYGVKNTTISMIKLRKRWAHVSV